MVGRAFDGVDVAALTRRTMVAAVVLLLLCPRSFAQGADFSGAKLPGRLAEALAASI